MRKKSGKRRNDEKENYAKSTLSNMQMIPVLFFIFMNDNRKIPTRSERKRERERERERIKIRTNRTFWSCK